MSAIAYRTERRQININILKQIEIPNKNLLLTGEQATYNSTLESCNAQSHDRSGLVAGVQSPAGEKSKILNVANIMKRNVCRGKEISLAIGLDGTNKQKLHVSLSKDKQKSGRKMRSASKGTKIKLSLHKYNQSVRKIKDFQTMADEENQTKRIKTPRILQDLNTDVEQTQNKQNISILNIHSEATINRNPEKRKIKICRNK